MSRTSEISRNTKETSISVAIDLDGSAAPEVSTGIPFFDHMLDQLGRHGGFTLRVTAQGDLQVDTHHTIEDTGIALGEALAQALGDKSGVTRFSSIRVPLDEALVEAVVDLSGRPYLLYDLDPRGTQGDSDEPVLGLGTPAFDPQLAEEFFRALVTSAAITLHITLVRGKNTHHIIEACFKAVARALREAIAVVGTEVPSTKGSL